MIGGISMKESWDNIEKKYPDKWVVLKNVSFTGLDIDSAEVVEVKDDSDIIEYQENHLDDGYIFRRTTEGIFNGPVRANFEIKID